MGSCRDSVVSYGAVTYVSNRPATIHFVGVQGPSEHHGAARPSRARPATPLDVGRVSLHLLPVATWSAHLVSEKSMHGCRMVACLPSASDILSLASTSPYATPAGKTAIGNYSHPASLQPARGEQEPPLVPDLLQPRYRPGTLLDA